MSLTILTQTTEPVYAKDIAQIVQQQLGEAGIQVNIELLEFGQWVQRWLKADFDMAPGLNSGQPDPDFYLFRYFTNDGNLNFIHSYQNDTSSDAIKRARTIADPARRRELYATAQKELVAGRPVRLALRRARLRRAPAQHEGLRPPAERVDRLPAPDVAG